MPFSHFRLLTSDWLQINPSNAKSNHLKSFKIKRDKMASYCFYQYARKWVFYSLKKCDFTVFTLKLSHLRWNQGSICNDPCLGSVRLLFHPWEIWNFILSQITIWAFCLSKVSLYSAGNVPQRHLRHQSITFDLLWVLVAAAVMKGLQILAAYLQVSDHSHSFLWNDSKLWHFY